MKKIVFLSLLLFSNMLSAQLDPSNDIYKAIIAHDSLLFDEGFNTCDISQFEKLYSADFEFFHDKAGLSNKEQFIKQAKEGLCKSPKTYQARRELALGSTQIFPLHNNGKLYGAIQVGEHNFHEKIAGQAEKTAGSARFTHVWTLNEEVWQLKRSLSFNHQSKAIENTLQLSDATLEEWIKSKNIPTFGLGLIKNGKLKSIKVIGDITQGESAPYNTIFNVASLTKPVTAMIALRLASLGKWDLDAPLYTHWIDPDLKDDERHKLITTRLILSHQTGLPNWRRDKQLAFSFTPGTGYQYSGEGFEYLREALEKKFNTSLDALASEYIFHPLSMHDSQYIWHDNMDEQRVALGFSDSKNAYDTYKRKKANAADDLLTTVEDYGNFLVASMHGTGLSDAVFNDMQSKQVASKKGKHFSLGFERYDFKDGNFALSHGGSDNGVKTISFIFPKTQQGILIITNIDDGYKVYKELLREYLGEYGEEIMEIEKS